MRYYSDYQKDNEYLYFYLSEGQILKTPFEVFALRLICT
jgi:hypothetical protein